MEQFKPFGGFLRFKLPDAKYEKSKLRERCFNVLTLQTFSSTRSKLGAKGQWSPMSKYAFLNPQLSNPVSSFLKVKAWVVIYNHTLSDEQIYNAEIMIN